MNNTIKNQTNQVKKTIIIDPKNEYPLYLEKLKAKTVNANAFNIFNFSVEVTDIQKEKLKSEYLKIFNDEFEYIKK